MKSILRQVLEHPVFQEELRANIEGEFPKQTTEVEDTPDGEKEVKIVQATVGEILGFDDPRIEGLEGRCEVLGTFDANWMYITSDGEDVTGNQAGAFKIVVKFTFPDDALAREDILAIVEDMEIDLGMLEFEPAKA